MSFEDFPYPAVLNDLQLTSREHDLHGGVAPVILDPGFRNRLAIGAAVAQATNTEKPRYELIIALVLLELQVMGMEFGLFSGV